MPQLSQFSAKLYFFHLLSGSTYGRTSQNMAICGIGKLKKGAMDKFVCTYRDTYGRDAEAVEVPLSRSVCFDLVTTMLY